MSEDQYVFDELSANYESYFRYLVGLVELLTRNAIWGSEGTPVFPGGWSPEDIAQHVILKTLSGERKYDRNRGELKPWLRYQVLSVLSARTKSPENRYEMELLEEEAIEDRQAITPENALIEKQHQETVSQRISALYEAADNDADLLRVMDTMIDTGEHRPRFLAEKLNTEIKDIYNLLKRLRRLKRKVKLGNESEE